MVDIDNIFELFSEGDNLDGSNDSTTYIDFKETPTYWVGMFKKLILNHNNFNKKVIQFFEKANEELDLDDVKEAGEFVIYNRAWSYIRHIDINAKLHVKSLEKYTDEYLDVALKLSIHFFEQQEEYEKCILLKSILDKIEEIKE
tara:strand:+ start:485 stop:916 length:432 start_codon:yes stop_codon:yes gene_type:complete